MSTTSENIRIVPLTKNKPEAFIENGLIRGGIETSLVQLAVDATKFGFSKINRHNVIRRDVKLKRLSFFTDVDGQGHPIGRIDVDLTRNTVGRSENGNMITLSISAPVASVAITINLYSGHVFSSGHTCTSSGILTTFGFELEAYYELIPDESKTKDGSIGEQYATAQGLVTVKAKVFFDGTNHVLFTNERSPRIECLTEQAFAVITTPKVLGDGLIKEKVEEPLQIIPQYQYALTQKLSSRSAKTILDEEGYLHLGEYNLFHLSVPAGYLYNTESILIADNLYISEICVGTYTLDHSMFSTKREEIRGEYSLRCTLPNGTLVITLDKKTGDLTADFEHKLSMDSRNYVVDDSVRFKLVAFYQHPTIQASMIKLFLNSQLAIPTTEAATTSEEEQQPAPTSMRSTRASTAAKYTIDLDLTAKTLTVTLGERPGMCTAQLLARFITDLFTQGNPALSEAQLRQNFDDTLEIVSTRQSCTLAFQLPKRIVDLYTADSGTVEEEDNADSDQE